MKWFKSASLVLTLIFSAGQMSAMQPEELKKKENQKKLEVAAQRAYLYFGWKPAVLGAFVVGGVGIWWLWNKWFGSAKPGGKRFTFKKEGDQDNCSDPQSKKSPTVGEKEAEGGMGSIFESENSESDYAQGSNFFFGRGVERDFEKAREYLEKVASQNEKLVDKAKANFLLGEIYRFGGNGIEKNFGRAKKYYKAAAEQNEHFIAKSLGECRLGEFYQLGLGKTKKDYKKALEKYQAAFDCAPEYVWGRALIEYRLGEIKHQGGLGIAINVIEAEQHFKYATGQNVNTWARDAAQKKLRRLRLESPKVRKKEH